MGKKFRFVFILIRWQSLVGFYFPTSIYIHPAFPNCLWRKTRDFENTLPPKYQYQSNHEKHHHTIYLGKKSNDYHDLDLILYSLVQTIFYTRPYHRLYDVVQHNCITMSNKPIFVATHPRACSTAFERACSKLNDPQTAPANLT